MMASNARIALGMLMVCTLSANGSSAIAAEDIKRQRPGVEPEEEQAPLQFYNPGALRRPAANDDSVDSERKWRPVPAWPRRLRWGASA